MIIVRVNNRPSHDIDHTRLRGFCDPSILSKIELRPLNSSEFPEIIREVIVDPIEEKDLRTEPILPSLDAEDMNPSVACVKIRTEWDHEEVGRLASNSSD